MEGVSEGGEGEGSKTNFHGFVPSVLFVAYRFGFELGSERLMLQLVRDAVQVKEGESARTYVYMCICIHMHKYIYVYIFVNLYVCICVHVYIYL